MVILNGAIAQLQVRQRPLPDTLACWLHPAGCYFIEKAYNAEKAGFKGVLIYDNIPERLLTMAAPDDHPEIAKLADDITIPTALLTQVWSSTNPN